MSYQGFTAEDGKYEVMVELTGQVCFAWNMIEPQYSEWIVGPLSSATFTLMFMQFTGCHQPVQRFYWPENAIDWLKKC